MGGVGTLSPRTMLMVQKGGKEVQGGVRDDLNKIKENFSEKNKSPTLEGIGDARGG